MTLYSPQPDIRVLCVEIGHFLLVPMRFQWASGSLLTWAKPLVGPSYFVDLLTPALDQAETTICLSGEDPQLLEN